MSLGTVIFIICLVVYILSILAVYTWHKIVSGTAEMSWVTNEDIYTPIHNTIMAFKLWRDFNPLK